MRRLMIVLGMVLLLLLAANVACADEGETEIVLPTLVRDPLIGGVAPGVVIVGLVQIAKRLGLKDGWAGRLVLILSIGALVLGVLAEYYEIEAEVGGALGVIEQVATAILYLLAMNVTSGGTYKFAKYMEVIKQPE